MASSLLSSTISKVRLFVDDQGTNAKYSDNDIMELMQHVWATVTDEINRNTQHPLVVTHTLTFQSGQTIYELPPTCGTVLRIAAYNANTHRMEWEMIPGGIHNPSGPGVHFVGRALKLDPNWHGANKTVVVAYVPNGDVLFHSGSVTASTDIVNDLTNFECTVALATTPTLGVADNRPNAYVGCVLRIISASATNDYVQERLITAYDVATNTATLEPCFDTGMAPTGTVLYEIIPPKFQNRTIAIAMGATAAIIGIEGDIPRKNAAEVQYQKALRTLRLAAANTEIIIGTRFSSQDSYSYFATQ